jgi:hypothetical protein
LTLVDIDCKFMFCIVGTNGSVSDGGVFAELTLSHNNLQENSQHTWLSNFLTYASIYIKNFRRKSLVEIDFSLLLLLLITASPL